MASIFSLYVRRKRFATTDVLRDVSLTVEPGEMVSLIGPSGCGKSTLLRLIAGLDTDFEGRLDFAAGDSVPENRIGVVFQEPRLLPWLTVAENVGFASRNLAADRPRILELLASVGLADAADKLPKALSGGMAQRAAIARGLFRPGKASTDDTAPRLLLLDEPFSAVDAFTRMHLQDLLMRLAARYGLACLIVTHDIDEAVYLGDRACVLQAEPGTIIAERAVTSSRPRDRRAAELAEARNDLLASLSTEPVPARDAAEHR